MADVLILGTVALDNIETPFKKGINLFGGSAAYASIACSLFAKPCIVSVVGKDMPKEYLDLLKARGIDSEGIYFAEKSFKWTGFYEFDMNVAHTRKTELNSLADFNPNVPESYKGVKFVFLANVDPDIQIKVLKSINKPELVVLDTMNFWIGSKKERLLEAIKLADVLVINDGEARELFQTTNLVQAAKKALMLVRRAVIVKKGEHGSLLFTHHRHFNAPGYPLENVFDPTGCGDSFGGAFIGYLAKTGNLDEKNMRKAVIYGSVVASFTAEDLGVNRLADITMSDVEKRFSEIREIREF